MNDTFTLCRKSFSCAHFESLVGCTGLWFESMAIVLPFQQIMKKYRKNPKISSEWFQPSKKVLKGEVLTTNGNVLRRITCNLMENSSLSIISQHLGTLIRFIVSKQKCCLLYKLGVSHKPG